MNQQYSAYSPSQGICEYIPNYHVKSDYLPTNRVIQGTSPQTTELVILFLFSSGGTRKKKEGEESSPRDPMNSTLPDMYPIRLTSMWILITASMNKASAESREGTEENDPFLLNINENKTPIFRINPLHKKPFFFEVIISFVCLKN